jgi:hypothetical protein
VRCAVLSLLAACGRGEPPQAAPARAAKPAVLVDAAGPCPIANPALGPGLTVERWYVADATPAAGEPCIDVVRADPSRYAVRARTDRARTATEWQKTFDLVAVINAGMFHDSGEPVGLVVADTKQRGADNAKFGGYFAWSPSAATLPAVTVLGRGCANAKDLAQYRSLVQSYRLLDCNGGAINWQDPKQYSAAAIGVDRAGRIVFLHARGAFTMRELSTALAAHDLAGAIFLEGGPEASLVVHGADGTLERVGSYETSFVENDGNTDFWRLPNVIALVTSSDR